MTPFSDPSSALVLIAAASIAFAAGVLKGSIGFGLPSVMIAGLSLLMPPDVALAGLIMAALVSNGWQALRGGVGQAVASVKAFRVFLIAGFVAMLAAAQLVPYLAANVMLWIIGVPVGLFALFGLLGRSIPLPGGAGPRVQAAAGALAGICGGLTGVWGPPTVALLTALETPKARSIPLQGVIYGLGAVTLTLAHLGSGVLNAQTLPLSVFLVFPALAGMALGFRFQDRLDQRGFTRATNLFLLVTAIWLILRGLSGG